MTANLLNNPIWNALTTEQSHCTSGGIFARRFFSHIAPFGAVSAPTSQAESELIQLVEPGEQICLVGIAPPFSAAWELKRKSEILQMVCQERIENGDDESDIQLLTDDDIPAMLALTALVYPAYFRAGTAGLGAYYGIYQNGQLAAMAGERMRITGFQEISAVCTHPDFLGRGYARRLVQHLVNKIWGREETPYLHVDADNTRAITLYERLGFHFTCSLPLWVIQRQT
jgi:ribosomal protein S18 acetylase RimI-like enzyme